MRMDRRSLFVASLMAPVVGFGSEAGAAEGGKGESINSLPNNRNILKAYAKSSIGQIHYRYVAPAQDTGKLPLVFFHPNPFSGIYFNPSLVEFGKDRLAIAFDSPGYGESARPDKPATMEEVAKIFGEALDDMGYGKSGKKVDVTGFHTGGYIAPELAVQRPDLVRRVVLSGVPFWEGKLREEKRAELLVDHPVFEDGSSLMYEWNRWAARRPKGLSLARAYEIATSAMVAGPHVHWAYYGVINYDARPQFQKLQQPTLLLNPSGEALAETTRLAKPLIKNSVLIERPDLPHQIFDLAVAEIGKIYREFLDKA